MRKKKCKDAPESVTTTRQQGTVYCETLISGTTAYLSSAKLSKNTASFSKTPHNSTTIIQPTTPTHQQKVARQSPRLIPWLLLNHKVTILEVQAKPLNMEEKKCSP